MPNTAAAEKKIWNAEPLTTKAGRNKLGVRFGDRRLFDVSVYDDTDRAAVSALLRAGNVHHELVEALKGLGRPGPLGDLCFDECRAHGLRSHSPACEAARDVLAKLGAVT